MRPLRELEPLLHTLNSLGVNEADELRFFTRPPSSEELEGATEDEKKLFEFAIGIDYSARELIRHALSVAAERSVERVEPWLKSAVKGGLEATVGLQVSRFTTEGQLENQAKVNRQAVLDRANRLESFAEVALFLAGEMKRMLAQDTEEAAD